MRKLCLQRSKSRYFFELFFFVVCFHKSSIVARYSLAHKLQFDCHMALACLAFSFSEEKRKFLKNMCQTQIGSIENFFLFLFWFICELGWKLRMGVWKKIRDSLDLTTVGNGRHIYESLWLTKIDMATVHTTHTHSLKQQNWATMNLLVHKMCLLLHFLYNNTSFCCLCTLLSFLLVGLVCRWNVFTAVFYVRI